MRARCSVYSISQERWTIGTALLLDALGLSSCDVLGFSLGGMVAQQLPLDRPSIPPERSPRRPCNPSNKRPLSLSI